MSPSSAEKRTLPVVALVNCSGRRKAGVYAAASPAQNNPVAFCSSTDAKTSGVIADIRHHMRFNSCRDMSNDAEHMLREATGGER